MSDLPSVLAVVSGESITELPRDLFIPPDAMEVLLEQFTGPLDLLLYLIRKQNLDILDIPISQIMDQYLEYIHLMEKHRIELAADYLVMAALLAEIKSRLLLPKLPVDGEEFEEDPRLALVQRLQIYEQFKLAAEQLDSLNRQERDSYVVTLPADEFTRLRLLPDVALSELLTIMQAVMTKAGNIVSHRISREVLSVRDRVSHVLELLQSGERMPLSAFYLPQEGRSGLVVSLLAILELGRQALIVIWQENPYQQIFVQAN